MAIQVFLFDPKDDEQSNLILMGNIMDSLHGAKCSSELKDDGLKMDVQMVGRRKEKHKET